MPPRSKKPPAPTLVVETRAIGDLVSDPENARAHDDRNVNAIRASLRRFGMRKPIVIDTKNIVVAGNGTLEALTLEGYEWVDVLVYPGTTEEARAFAIADNRTAELAHWAGDQLLANLRTLPDDLLAATGYDADDLADFMERFGDGPSLDALGANPPNPEDTWPTLRIAMPKAVLDRYYALVDRTDAAMESDQFAQIIEWAEAGRTKRRRTE